MIAKSITCWLSNVHNLSKKVDLHVDGYNECLELETVIHNDKIVGEETEIKLREICCF